MNLFVRRKSDRLEVPHQLFLVCVDANRRKIAVVGSILEETACAANKPALHGLSFAGKFRDSC